MDENISNAAIMSELDRTYLFDKAMEGDWEAVVTIFEDQPWAGRVKISKGDTALHIAVLDRQESIVQKLVQMVANQQNVLDLKNEQGDTPLHLAAAIGNVSMCLHIAAGRPYLVGVCNEERETPLFLAARHGKIDAFFCLLSLSGRAQDYAKRRNKNGETVLHCAITGGHFKLAYLISERYEVLVNTIDDRGVSPLHLLANKPTAFRSGTDHLGLVDKIIYHCILVPEVYRPLGDDKDSKNQTSTNLFGMLWSKINIFTEPSRTIGDLPMDASQDQRCIDAAEKLEEGRGIIQDPPNSAVGEPIDDGRREQWRQYVEHRRQVFPPNYDTCFNFIKFVFSFKFIELLIKVMLGILFFGPGASYINKKEQKKEKHIWSAMVMQKLLKQDKKYRYDVTGKNPQYAERTMPYETRVESEEETRVQNVYFSHERAEQGNYRKKLPCRDSSEEVPYCIQEIEQKHGHNSNGNDKETQLPDERNGGGNFLQNQGWQKSYKEDPNWSLLLRLGKAGLRAEPIIVAGQAAKKLDDELLLESKNKKTEGMGRLETPILIAAKNGIKEMVERILNLYPVAIHDIDSNKKNIVLLAVENRHPHVYEFLLKRNILKDSVFGAVDNNGNSALHLAAMFADYRPWLTPGAALQMQWEVKWYEFVKKSMPPNFFRFHNNENESAKLIFTREHKGLVQNGGQWLNSTATSCSVVATLIATVAFATSTAVPGGTKEGSGRPNLEKQPAFHVFAISSLIALCFSVTSTVTFLAILTSRYQEQDFGKDLPKKLLAGLTSLFISIAAILLSFCAGHFYVLKDELKIAAFPVYAVTCLPATLFAIAQFPLYLDLIWTIFSRVPQPCLEDDT